MKTPELDELADQIGHFIQYWGFKQIHGRIWTHLYLSETPLDTATLMKRLKVSKTLMSFSLRDLLEYEVVEEAHKGPHGTVFYRANPNITAVILNVLRIRERRMMSRIQASFKLLKETPSQERIAMKLAPKQLTSLGELIESASSALDLFVTMTEGTGQDFCKRIDAFHKE